MVSGSQILQVIHDFLQHDDLEKFVSEFSRLSFNIRQRGNSSAVEWAQIVECAIAELHSGHVSPSEFRDGLRGAILPVANQVTAPGFAIQVNAPAVVEKGFPASRVSSGTSPAVVLGSPIPYLKSGKVQMTNQWTDNFIALAELRKDEIAAAQKLAE